MKVYKDNQATQLIKKVRIENTEANSEPCPLCKGKTFFVVNMEYNIAEYCRTCGRYVDFEIEIE